MERNLEQKLRTENKENRSSIQGKISQIKDKMLTYTAIGIIALGSATIFSGCFTPYSVGVRNGRAVCIERYCDHWDEEVDCTPSYKTVYKDGKAVGEVWVNDCDSSRVCSEWKTKVVADNYCD